MHNVTTTIRTNSDILGLVMSHTSLRDDNAPSLTIEVIELQLELSEGSGFPLANAAGSCLHVPDNNLWTFSSEVSAVARSKVRETSATPLIRGKGRFSFRDWPLKKLFNCDLRGALATRM